MTVRRFLVPALLFLTAATLAAQADKVDEFVTAEMKRQNVPGLSLVVIKDGKIVKSQGYGFADMKGKVAATPQTVYRIASVSKQFIAAGVMVLAQDGKLAIDDPIGRYLDGTPAAWKSITIRHLLTHTAGLIREAPGFDPSRVQSDADVLKTAYGLPLRFAPGEKWEYSNTGYFALAEIIRTVSGQPWPDFLNERIFAPSRMTTTYPTNTMARIANRAVGYSDNDRLQVAPDWRALRPSGAFLSTVLDLAKWDAVLDSNRILSDATRRQMWTPVTLNDGSTAPYGFGWQMSSFKGRRRIHHSGGMPGTRTEFARFPDDRLTIIVLMNLDDSDVDGLVTGLASLYQGDGSRSVGNSARSSGSFPPSRPVP